MDAYSLLKVNEYIRQVIALNFEESIWIDAEISQAKEVRGQLYLEFVEKSADNDNIMAKAQGVAWYKTLMFLKKKLDDMYESIIQEGVQIRFKARIEFHEAYGLRLNLEDIEPSYTLGLLALKRQKTIEKLQKENLLYKNRETILPAAISRIAIISSSTAAGLQDFMDQLDSNPFGYRFMAVLFDSSMQGSSVERDILQNLEKIIHNTSVFDCVAIIRGGGSKMDLACFDSFDISAAVANFPIPVLTGIGHEIDKNVIEMVAHSPLKTPTAVAEFIIQHNAVFETGLTEEFDSIKKKTVQLINQKSAEIKLTNAFISANLKLSLKNEHYRLNLFKAELKNTFSRLMLRENSHLNEVSALLTNMDPANILSQGYSYTTFNGKTIRSISQVIPGELIKTHLRDGCFLSKVDKKQVDENQKR